MLLFMHWYVCFRKRVCVCLCVCVRVRVRVCVSVCLLGHEQIMLHSYVLLF